MSCRFATPQNAAIGVYDLHQHLWPPPLIEALRARTQPPRLRGDVLELPSGAWPANVREHDLEVRIAALDRDGIDVAVVSCPPTLELDDELTEAYNEGIVDVVAGSGGRLRAVSAASVRDDFAGVGVAAWDVAGLDEIAPLLDEVQRRGQFLFVHPGPTLTPPGAPEWWPPVVGYTAQMQSAYMSWLAKGAEKWPDLRVLFAILAGGAPFQLERLASRGVDTRTVLHENVYLDAASYGERALDLVLGTYGVKAVVYGSDWPVHDGGATLNSIRTFGQAVFDTVCSDNPERLLE